MTAQHFNQGATGCSNPAVSENITPYCFGDLSEDQRWFFEAHLLECEACWREVQRLDEVVQSLRSDRALARAHFLPSIVQSIGISGDVQHPFAGHSFHVLLASFLWAALFGISVPMELAYKFESFGNAPQWMAFYIFLWMSLGSILAFGLATRLARDRKRAAGALAICVLIAFGSVMYAAVRPQLPDFGVTGSIGVQSATAQSAFFKTLVYFLPFATVFLVIPFHTVVSMQRESFDGKHNLVWLLLTGNPDALTPRGVAFVSAKALIAIFGAATIISFTMLMVLIDHLAPGPNMNRFTILVELRWAACLAPGIIAVTWYQRMLTELKRECLAMRSLVSEGSVNS